MKIKSAKAKGRRACQQFVDLLKEAYPMLTEEDLRICPSSCNGVDIAMSEKARNVIGLNMAPEVKNQKNLPLWKSLEQATRLAEEGQTPLLVFTKNHKGLHVAMKAQDFIKLLKRKDDGRLLGINTG